MNLNNDIISRVLFKGENLNWSGEGEDFTVEGDLNLEYHGHEIAIGIWDDGTAHLTHLGYNIGEEYDISDKQSISDVLTYIELQIITLSESYENGTWEP